MEYFYQKLFTCPNCKVLHKPLEALEKGLFFQQLGGHLFYVSPCCGVMIQQLRIPMQQKQEGGKTIAEN